MQLSSTLVIQRSSWKRKGGDLVTVAHNALGRRKKLYMGRRGIEQVAGQGGGGVQA